MGRVQVTVVVSKSNVTAKMGVTVTKTGPSAVFVSDLKQGFCGANAGLMLNDVILQVNQEIVETPVQCTDLFKGMQELTIVVERESALDTSRANTPQAQSQQIPSKQTPTTAAPAQQKPTKASAVSKAGGGGNGATPVAASAAALAPKTNAPASAPAAAPAASSGRCFQCFQCKKKQ